MLIDFINSLYICIIVSVVTQFWYVNNGGIILD
jgi:hypothetical protein